MELTVTDNTTIKNYKADGIQRFIIYMKLVALPVYYN